MKLKPSVSGIAIAGLLAAVILSGQSVRAAENTPVEVIVTPVPDKAGQTDLHIRVKNRGTSDLKMFRASLPWGNSRSMYLNAVRQLTPLIAPTPIDDPVAGDITIKPGETVEGDINLHGRFPSMEKELTKDDVDLFWTYRATLTDGSVVARFGGWIPLPRKR